MVVPVNNKKTSTLRHYFSVNPMASQEIIEIHSDGEVEDSPEKWCDDDDSHEIMELLVLPPDCQQARSPATLAASPLKKKAKTAGGGRKKKQSKSDMHAKMKEAAVSRLEGGKRWFAVPPDHFRKYYLTVMGKPETWSRPKFMSWLNPRSGGLMRRVVDANREKVGAIRRQVEDHLFHHHSVLPRFYPVFPNDVKLVCEIEFYRRPPNDMFVDRDRTQIKPRHLDELNQGPLVLDGKRPDLDNMVKLVLDLLEGIMYSDDTQVVKVVAVKAVDLTPPYEGRTEICLYSVNPGSRLRAVTAKRRGYEEKTKPRCLDKESHEGNESPPDGKAETYCNDGRWYGLL